MLAHHTDQQQTATTATTAATHLTLMGSACTKSTDVAGPPPPTRTSGDGQLRAVSPDESGNVAHEEPEAAQRAPRPQDAALPLGMTETEVDLTHFEVYPAIRTLKSGHPVPYGSVHPARKRDTGRMFSLMMFRKRQIVPNHVHTVIQQRLFLQEARCSKFLASLHYAFQTPTHLFAVTTWMPGGTLRNLLQTQKDGKMDEVSARFYAAEIVLGLEALHSQRLIYRDLCPGNVLIDETGHSRLGDFSLCRRVNRSDYYKATGKAGTRGYVAPEVLNNQLYSFGVDVFSLGVVLYEMVHGRRPFSHKDREEFIEPDDSFDVDASLSAELQDLIEKCMCFSEKHRIRIRDLRRHAWFNTTDWSAVRRRDSRAPFVPPASDANEFTPQDCVQVEHTDDLPLVAMDEERFREWSFKTEFISRRLVMERLLDGGAGSGTESPNRRRTMPPGRVSPRRSEELGNGSHFRDDLDT